MKRIYDLQEVRAVDNERGEKIIEGHAAVFNQRANIGGEFYEVIERGAFDGADLKNVYLFVAHDHRQIPLARTTSGTMTLTVDNVGLAIRARLDVENNPAAQVLYSSICRGDICGMSFCFNVAQDDWQDLRTEMPTRIIRKIKRVFEVSACAEPAYVGTDLHAEAERTLTDARKKVAEQAEVQRLRQQIREKAAEPQRQINALKISKRAVKTKEMTKVDATFFERAGEKLREQREAVIFPSGNPELRVMTLNPPAGVAATVTVPTYSGTSINLDNSAQISSLVDAVAHLSLKGGENFRQPFAQDVAISGYTNEMAAAIESDLTFGYSEIRKCKITAYVEISEELAKLPNADYASYVFQICRTAIRKKLANEILNGVGEVDSKPRIVGIFSEQAAGLDASTDLSISAIRDTTLDDIIFAYDGVGSDSTSAPTLILNKHDLHMFAQVRTSTKQKFYDVKFLTVDTGTISGVPFILSPDVPALMSTETAAGASCMVFGNLKNYLLTEFSELEIKRSDDFKFREGMTCFRASVMIGGNTVARNSFVRIKKA